MNKDMLTPKDILMDTLNTSKALCTLYATFLTEASNDDTVYTIGELEDETVDIQRDVFNLLYDKGWYKLEADSIKNIKNTINQYKKSKGEM